MVATEMVRGRHSSVTVFVEQVIGLYLPMQSMIASIIQKLYVLFIPDTHSIHSLPFFVHHYKLPGCNRQKNTWKTSEFSNIVLNSQWLVDFMTDLFCLFLWLLKQSSLFLAKLVHFANIWPNSEFLKVLLGKNTIFCLLNLLSPNTENSVSFRLVP